MDYAFTYAFTDESTLDMQGISEAISHGYIHL